MANDGGQVPSIFPRFGFSYRVCHGTQLANPNSKSQLIRAINYLGWDRVPGGKYDQYRGHVLVLVGIEALTSYGQYEVACLGLDLGLSLGWV